MHVKLTTTRAATAAALLIAALPGLVHAQQGRGGLPGQDLEGTMAELTEELDLNEDQASQVRGLLAAQNEASSKMIEEARASGQGRAAFGAMRERMMEMRKETDAQMKTILSVEQMSKYDAIVAKRLEERAQRRGQGPPPGGQRGGT